MRQDRKKRLQYGMNMETKAEDAAVQKELVLFIGGMTCASCQNRIEKKLRSAAGVQSAEVSYRTGRAAVTYNPECIALEGIRALVEELGYRVIDGGAEIPSRGGAASLFPRKDAGRGSPAAAAGTLVIIFALYMLLRQFGTGALAPAFPLAEAGMGYGMLFVIGLVTSVHCVAMCGGINLSQCMPNAVTLPAGTSFPRAGVLLPAALYNGGRVISYTVVGAAVGALGSVITVSGRMQGIVQLAAGVFMVIMGINMLGIFPGLRRLGLHLPRLFTRRIEEKKEASRNPFVIGLLNGLMPCGPLQAMQLYALSTGSPASGAVSMFLFSMGTVPLVFFVGALSSMASRKFSAPAMKAGAILVTVLGLTMFTNGWSLGGFSLLFGGASGSASPFGAGIGARMNRGGSGDVPIEPVIRDGMQIVNSTLSGGRYPAITVREGIPVRWTITAPEGSINGCNNRMIIREYGIEHRFRTGENIVEFTPGRTGRIPYSCWMGMIRSSITVVSAGEPVIAEAGPDAGADAVSPKPAGVTIPVESAAVAGINADGSLQEVGIELRDDGFNPSLVVMQRGVRTEWTINNDSLDEGNSVLVFPAYYARVPVETGDNVIGLLPAADFEFYTVDGVYYGYVKVVDDLDDIDIEAIRAEVSAHETLIYPDAYFDAASQGGCGMDDAGA
jgi:sulfite exporter TauE/SafE/copper chaperone CopZ